MSLTVDPLAVRVISARMLTPFVRQLTLSPIGAERLPGFSAGAHISVEVELEGRREWRRYSLVSVDTKHVPLDAPTQYVIAVQLEQNGLGGSKYMHQIQEGSSVKILAPRNDFELDAEAEEVVLLGGGIGITPLMTMAAHCVSVNKPFRLIYAGRERKHMAYADELQEKFGHCISVHSDKEQEGVIDLANLLKTCGSKSTLHVCGPKGLLDGVLAKSKALNWPDSKVRFELFSTPAHQEQDASFDIVLRQSGQTLSVPANKSILEILEEAGHDPMFDCRRGECGVCACAVLEGDIDHRDYVLTDREKTAGNLIVTCVSRAASARLVLDM